MVQCRGICCDWPGPPPGAEGFNAGKVAPRPTQFAEDAAVRSEVQKASDYGQARQARARTAAGGPGALPAIGGRRGRRRREGHPAADSQKAFHSSTMINPVADR